MTIKSPNNTRPASTRKRTLAGFLFLTGTSQALASSDLKSELSCTLSTTAPTQHVGINWSFK